MNYTHFAHKRSSAQSVTGDTDVSAYQKR